jgi:hypothetical protein
MAEPVRHSLPVEQEKALLQKKDRRRAFLFSCATAISLLFISTLCVFFWFQRTPDCALPRAQRYRDDLPPATTGATLKLSDGATFILDDSLDYSKVANSSTGQYQLTTSNGQIFSAVLPDSTKVWLDAGSTLLYPAHFAGSQRTVQLKGEAYFEVHPDPQRLFNVSLLDEAIVKTHGAKFNIFAYADEPGFCTSVLSGSTEMDAGTIWKESLNSGQTVLYWRLKELYPPITTELNWAVGWKNNLFVLDHQDINTLMKDLERWYDARIIYEGDAQNDTTCFFGTMPRTVPVSKLLRLVESESHLRFTTEGHTIHVMKSTETLQK